LKKSLKKPKHYSLSFYTYGSKVIDGFKRLGLRYLLLGLTRWTYMPWTMSWP